MSLLLLYRNTAGVLAVGPGVITLSAPPITASMSGTVGMQVDAGVITLTAPAAAMLMGVRVDAGVITLSAPTATIGSTGTVGVSVDAGVITITGGAAAMSFDQTQVIFLLNGVPRGFERSSMVITDELNEVPNTCSFLIASHQPQKYQEVIVAIGGINRKEFSGYITNVQLAYRDSRENLIWSVSCVDHTRRLDRNKVLKRYVGQSASAIVLDILSTYTVGFTTANVQLGLATIALIDFTMEDVTRALSRIAKLIGASWYVDYDKDVHFFIDEVVDTPDDIDDVNIGYWSPSYGDDTSQVRTRAVVEGGGSVVSVDLVAGSNTIPVDTGVWYSSSGGQVKSGPQAITYTSKSTLDETGSTVAGKLLSPGALTASVVPGTSGRLSTGTYQYQVTFVSALGESEVGTTSSTATITDITTPSAPSPSFSATAGNLTLGSYTYKVTYVTSAGESAASSASSTASVTEVSAPGTPSPSAVAGASGNLLPGSYSYKITYQTSAGETTGSGTGSASITDISAPSTPSGSVVSGATGNLLPGNYSYKATYVTATGETLTSSSSSNIAVSDVSTASAPSGSPVAATAGGLRPGNYGYLVTYITSRGETTAGSTSSAVTLSDISSPSSALTATAATVTGGAIVPDGFTRSYRVSFITALGETVTGSNTSSAHTLAGANNAYVLTSIPTSSDARVIGRRIYRDKNDGSGFKFVAEIRDNTTGSYTDGLSDASRGAAPLGADTGTSGQITVTVPTSGDSRVIGRNIYRTERNGSTYYFLTRLNDNSDTSFTDSIADTALGGTTPSASTAGSGQITVTIPTSGDSRVGKRYVYRTPVGGSVWKLVALIGDNTTTSFVDNLPDSSLGVIPPTTSTAGSGQMTVTIPTSGDSRTTSRLVYRTPVGGSDYKLIATIGNNTATSFVDNVPDTSRGTPIPALNTTGRGQMTVTIPTSGDGRVTGRNVYRTPVNGGEWRRVATIGNNTATSFTDNTSDASQLLGALAPSTSTAGSGQITVTNLPLGPPGTTGRRVYRVEANGSSFRFLTAIGNNTSTGFTDNNADTSLGEVAPSESMVGAAAGDTSLRVKDLSKYVAGGWIRAGDQVIRFTGRSGSSGEGTLTGIPTSGVGSIGAGIPWNASVVNHPHLTGVSGISYDLKHGDSVNVLVTRNNLAAQAIIAAAEGPPSTGIWTSFDQDQRYTIATCTELADANLELFSDSEMRATFDSRDRKLRSGKTLPINVGPPTNVVGSFRIQKVIITGFDKPGVLPQRHVTASNYIFTLDHLFRRVELGA